MKALLSILFALLLCGSAFSQFKADMVQTSEGVATTSKLYVEGSFYCIEQEEGGTAVRVIVNKDEMVTRVLRPEDKMYIEMSSTGMMSKMNDVFMSVEDLQGSTDAKLLGKEEVNGYSCDKYVVNRDGKDVMNFWVSSELEFPVKVVNLMGNKMTMELKNIKMGDIDDSMFKIPDGYTKMEMPGMK
ncbi:MAG: DUF4412 domain-containing protein [Ignavibacteriaceae bacterium]|nr:DUF4412 domain-containing protein [Ignavibacteriaceae bacterium]